MLCSFNKGTSTSGWSLYIILQVCVNRNSKTLILSLKNSNFSDIACCQGRKTISFIWRFDRPSCSSCKLCTALILDPATKTNCFLCNQIVFRKGLKNRVPKDFLCACLSKALIAHDRISKGVYRNCSGWSGFGRTTLKWKSWKCSGS